MYCRFYYWLRLNGQPRNRCLTGSSRRQLRSVCVDNSTLPAGAKLNPNCKNIKVLTEDTTFVELSLTGDFCLTPPPPGACWMTGGGTLGKGKTPDYSYGGVVYPGCSPKAAEGGDWNVVSHNDGLHFQGQAIVVDACSGDPTSSPKVNVRIIDFHGTGILSGIGGDPADTVPVTFVARAIDNHDGGAGSDQLYLNVTIGATTVLQRSEASVAASCNYQHREYSDPHLQLQLAPFRQT